MSTVLAVRGLALIAAAFALSSAAHAQSDALWTDLPTAARAALGAPASPLASFRAVRLDRAAMAARLAAAPPESAGRARGVDVPVPSPDGSLVWFRVVEAPVMAPALQARYPAIRTYVGQGRDEPSATVRISLTPAGFAAMARTPGGTIYVDPYTAATPADEYVSYFRRDLILTDAQRAALAAETVEDERTGDAGAAGPAGDGDGAAARTTNGALLRTYRLAVSATVEYSAAVGGRTVPGTLAAQVVAINRINQVYENELAVRLELVANNDTLIFAGPPGTIDPFDDANTGNVLLGQNQTVVDARIGTANYDIGHIFSTGGGGVAGLGVVCSAGSKARGVTGLPNPVGDGFYIDYVAHEMGHQFRGNHTFNGNQGSCAGGNRNATTAFEPGSGTTVMAYAGICGSNDTQTFSDPFFHAISLQEVVNFITTGTGSTCGVTTPTNNVPPVVTVQGNGTIIPVRTSFALTGAATDDTPGSLTYSWEDFNLGPAGAPANTGVPVGAPFFRTFVPSVSPTRTFPQISRQFAGQAPVRGEGLPTVGRVLNFRLTARDNQAGGGGISDANLLIATDAGAGPFAVTVPNTAGLTFQGGSTQTVTWAVANTDLLDDAGAPDADGVDVETVDILYTANAGAAYTTLLAGTPNDGSADIVLPNVTTATGRVLIRSVGNLFYDLNDANFSVAFQNADEAQARAATGLTAVAPNPATGRASFALRSASTEAVMVAVYDALGRRVALLHDGPVGVEEAFSVDVSRLPAGVYVVRASGGAVQSTQRFTVVR